MSVLFSDLKDRRVIGFNTSNGNVIVNDSGKPKEFELWLGPSGQMIGREPEPVPIDQVGEREVLTPAQRWAAANIDQ